MVCRFINILAVAKQPSVALHGAGRCEVVGNFLAILPKKYGGHPGSLRSNNPSLSAQWTAF